MKKFSIGGCTIGIIFVVLVAILFGSCNRKNPEKIRQTKERYITIINNTGSVLEGYMVNTANGVEIKKEKTSNNSFSIKIGDGFKNDPNIEVVLVDVYKRIYTRTFNVPLEGNTDTPISAGDRKSEGVVTDKYKDLVAWLNEHK